ncbi:MAG: tRNA preQ1(34) S-adenosylmethionine ribosyltransferase-isomerase QueA [bacterium]|nr:MAG: tRNA preQ1(34) S-adenosylmethionine ribosyltransferase-isomerase QueA [bacterium]
MKVPDPLSLEAFDYDLPEDLVAQSPAEKRTGSRLLRLDRRSGSVEHLPFAGLARTLREGDLLVLNDTRVFPARLYARRQSGGLAEVLLLKFPTGAGKVPCLVRPARRFRDPERLTAQDGSLLLVRREGDRFTVTCETHPLALVVERCGRMPLPPYIRRDSRERMEEDRERYQTVYARYDGAVAAPTAGLHFDEEMLRGLEEKGVLVRSVTLHVGPGTFLPVRSADITRHRMEEEWYNVPEETALQVALTKGAGGRVVAVGTTVVRTLESAWAAGGLRTGEGTTDLFIYPGYRFMAVDALLTNFHLPRSTLLMLVCAFGGTRNVLEAYRTAVRERYRFYSYGDAMFIQ